MFDFLPLKGLVDGSNFSFFGQDIGFDPNDKLVALFLFEFGFNSFEELFVGFDMPQNILFGVDHHGRGPTILGFALNAILRLFLFLCHKIIDGFYVYFIVFEETGLFSH